MDRHLGWTMSRVRSNDPGGWGPCFREIAEPLQARRDLRQSFADNRRARLRAKRAARMLFAGGEYRNRHQREWARMAMRKGATFTVYDWGRP